MMLRTYGFILAGVVATAACGDEQNPIVPPGPRDETPPVIVAVQPTDGAVGVPLDSDVRVTFSEPINPATVAGASFFLTRDGQSVPGVYLHEAMTAVFQPDSALDSMRVYEATVTAAVRDPTGNPLPDRLTWSFTTGVAATPALRRDR